MKRLAAGVLFCLVAIAASSPHAQTPIWSQPHKPFRVYGNTWYVGTEGLSAILVTSPKGHILIDGTMPGNVAQIEANIRALGFRVEDIRVILNSHAHFDHAGAIAALAHDSGAKVRASVASARAMTLGGNDPDDPQYGMAPTYPPVHGIETIGGGEVIRVGDLALTAHATPGHTPGGTSWTWRSCEKDQCLNMVYADSITAFSNDTYRFTDDTSHPHRVEDFRKTIDTVASFPCDVLMVTHPDTIDFLGKVAARDAGKRPDPVIDSGACRAYASGARTRLEARLAKEQATK
jgi:metallo-beta-lactamase class B